MSTSHSEPKSHHYVPASYLSRFSDAKGFVHLYDRVRNKIRFQKPKKIMKIDSYYRQTWAPAGIDENVFEKGLGSGIEAHAKSILDKLETSSSVLNEEDLANLLLYIEIQRIRVPRQAKLAVELMRSTILSLLPKHEAEMIHLGHIQLLMKDSARFDYMRIAIGTIHPWLSRMEWEIFSAEEGSSFLTSDSPVCFYNPSILPPAEAGVGLAGTIVLFPISSRHILLMRHPECRTSHPLKELPIPPKKDFFIPISRGAIWPSSTVASTNHKIAALSHELIAAQDTQTLRTSGWVLPLNNGESEKPCRRKL